MRKLVLRALVLVLSLFLSQQPAFAQGADAMRIFFTIAGGNIGGNYFAVARALCREVAQLARGGMRCSPEATPGSVYNLIGLRKGELDFAIVQSDWLTAARDGTGRFRGEGSFPTLRGVAVLYREAITIIVRKDAGIETPTGLLDHRVDVGVASSGRRATAENVFALMGIDTNRFALLSELPTSAAVDELCAGRLDAVFLVVGHPETNVMRALSRCNATVLPVAGPEVGKALGGIGLYEPVVIPAGAYPEIASNVATFGVTAALVTQADAPAEAVDILLRALRDRKRQLVRSAPVLEANDTEHSWPTGSPVPPYR